MNLRKLNFKYTND
jgi:hypothetical protein